MRNARRVVELQTKKGGRTYKEFKKGDQVWLEGTNL
jgi:hypothetical protein